MVQLFGIVVLAVGLVAYAVQRRRRMAQVVAEAHLDTPMQPCAVDGAADLYDEVRWLRIALEAPQTGPRTGVYVTAGSGGIGVGLSHRTHDPVPAPSHAHRLAQAWRMLGPNGRAALAARGVAPALDRIAAAPDAVSPGHLPTVRVIEAALTAQG